MFVGMAGALRAAVVDPELLEVPFPGRDFGDFGDPDALGGDGKTGDSTAGGEDRGCTVGGVIDDGCVGGAAVLRFEDDGICEGVGAGGDQDFDFLAGLDLAGGAELADLVACGGEGVEGAVRRDVQRDGEGDGGEER
jgi:hypothetical protein